MRAGLLIRGAAASGAVTVVSNAVAVHDDMPEGWQRGGKVIVMAHGV